MANSFPSQLRVSPHFAEPELIVTYTQPSGAFSLLKDGKPTVKLDPGDLNVYINTLDLRTDSQATQGAANLLPSASLVGGMIGTQTYRLQCRAVYNFHDMEAAGAYSVSVPDAQSLALRQGLFQQMRNALLYGINATNGEGLLNASGATAVNLPADSFGNTTLLAYDNGQLALWFLQQVVALKNSMYQSGFEARNRIVMVGPQRVLEYMQLQAIVQVTSYQRPGAGTSTSLEVIKAQIEGQGDVFEYQFDDTLIGKGAGGSDMVLLTTPEIEVPRIQGLNTGVANQIQPHMDAVNLMYADQAAPVVYKTPTPDAGIAELQEIRITSGWNPRGAGLFKLSIPYSS